MDALQVGDDAREILESAGVDSLIGKKNTVFYFYPKDFTLGCTHEAQDFRDTKGKFDELNTEIIGVSADSEESHKKFTDKYRLTFTLVSDPKLMLAGKCGAAGILGTAKRTTYLIDKAGKVRFVWPKVSVNGHAEDVLAKIKELGLA